MKIINFGSLNIDYVYSVTDFVSPGETILASKMEIFPGGKGLNQSIAAARAGAAVLHAGTVGRGGRFLKDTLAASEVDVSHLLESDAENGHAIIQINDNRQNAIIVFGGSNQCLNDLYIEKILAAAGPDDIILLQNEVNGIESIIRRAHDSGLKIAFNPSPFPLNPNQLPFELVDFLIVNEIEGAQLAQLSPETTYRKIAERLHSLFAHATVVLTCGTHGVLCYGESWDIFQEIFVVEAIDTTAAGDTFCGYFLAGLARGMSIQKCLKTSSAASAITVTRPGAAPSIPTMREVEEFLIQYSNTNP